MTEALNCPNCGAGVASDSRQCVFCKTLLKTVGCTQCLGLMFVGSKFCGHCGAEAAEVRSEGGSGGECPRCRKPLETQRIDQTVFRECQSCDGLWIDVETFENICADREKQSTVLGFLGSRTAAVPDPVKISYVPCPDCKQLMNRSNFARASGVVLDTCKQHGAWFDASELPAVIEFIRKGGMELARERERSEVRGERERLRADIARQSRMDQRFGTNDIGGRDESLGIRSFLRVLFE